MEGSCTGRGLRRGFLSLFVATAAAAASPAAMEKEAVVAGVNGWPLLAILTTLSVVAPLLMLLPCKDLEGLLVAGVLLGRFFL